jgi:predicted secreted hydrolase
MPGKVDLLLVQNRDAVFGCGTLSLGGSSNALSASGQAVKDVLYLDLMNAEELMLYRCTLTMSKDFLSGSFNVFDAQGQAWSGTLQGSRSA